jgi:CarboxypepD_reg-like domain
VQGHVKLTIKKIKHMRLTAIIIAICIIVNFDLDAQSRVVTGKVIAEDLETLPGVRIQNSDTNLLGKTDIDGRFSIQLPLSIDTLIISWIGMEWTTIQVPINCDNLDIILMYDAIYDFMSASKIDRLRMKRFKKLPVIHMTAFKKGIFTSEYPCYHQDFVPIKEKLDEIHHLRQGR